MLINLLIGFLIITLYRFQNDLMISPTFKVFCNKVYNNDITENLHNGKAGTRDILPQKLYHQLSE